MDKKVRHIAFDCRDYNDEREFWDTIAMQLKILTKAGYNTVFRYEDCGIYILEFEEQDTEYASLFYRWLTAEEYDVITDMRYEEESKSKSKCNEEEEN